MRQYSQCSDSYSQSVTVSVQSALFQFITVWGEPLCIFPSVFQKAVLCITLQMQVGEKVFCGCFNPTVFVSLGYKNWLYQCHTLPVKH